MEEFGLLLKGLGWIAHSDFLGQIPSNHPFLGESHRLDEMFLCPSLAGNIQEANQETVAGASTHDLLNVVLGFELDPVRGVQIPRGLSRDEVSVLVQNPSEDVWDQPWDASWSPAELYREWVRRLQLWCHAKENAFASNSRKACVDTCDGKAPIKPRCLFRQNSLSISISLSISLCICPFFFLSPSLSLSFFLPLSLYLSLSSSLCLFLSLFSSLLCSFSILSRESLQAPSLTSD